MRIAPMLSAPTSMPTLLPTQSADALASTALAPPQREADVRPIDATAPPTMQELWEVYGRAIMSLPGVKSAGWTVAEPNRIHVFTYDGAQKFLIDQVLADMIDGIEIQTIAADGSGEPPPGSWVRQPFNALRLATALPGVTDWSTSRLGTWNLHVDTKERAAWLKPLIERQIGGKVVRILLTGEWPD